MFSYCVNKSPFRHLKPLFVFLFVKFVGGDGAGVVQRIYKPLKHLWYSWTIVLWHFAENVKGMYQKSVSKI